MEDLWDPRMCRVRVSIVTWTKDGGGGEQMSRGSAENVILFFTGGSCCCSALPFLHIHLSFTCCFHSIVVVVGNRLDFNEMHRVKLSVVIPSTFSAMKLSSRN